MRRICFWLLRAVLVVCFGFALPSGVLAASLQSQSESESPVLGDGAHVVVLGLIRDLACAIQHERDTTSRNFGMGCITACAKLGSPLGLLADDGELYLPISAEMPDHNHNKELMPYLGKRVKIEGLVYSRGGMHGLVIEHITVLK